MVSDIMIWQVEEISMKRILVTIFLACFCVGAGWSQTATAPSPAPAAPQASAPVKDPVTASLRQLLPRSRNNTLGAISAMPADKFNYKPTPEQMSFAHLVVHIIGSNYSLCAKAADVAAPKVEEAKETDAKEKLLAAATASFDFCGEALGRWTTPNLATALNFSEGSNFRAPWPRWDWPADGPITMLQPPCT
jgi:hypothetical protein